MKRLVFGVTAAVVMTMIGSAAAMADCRHGGPRVGVSVGYAVAPPPVRYVASYPAYVAPPAYTTNYYAPAPQPAHVCRPAHRPVAPAYYPAPVYAPTPTFAPGPAYGAAYYNSGLTLTFGR